MTRRRPRGRNSLIPHPHSKNSPEFAMKKKKGKRTQDERDEMECEHRSRCSPRVHLINPAAGRLEGTSPVNDIGVTSPSEEGPPSLRDLPHQDTQELLLLRTVFPQPLPAGCGFSRPKCGLCWDVHLKEPALRVDPRHLWPPRPVTPEVTVDVCTHRFRPLLPSRPRALRATHAPFAGHCSSWEENTPCD